MNKGIWTVKEWFGEKINDEAKRFGMWLVGEYKDGMMDHTKLRVDNVIAETKKAVRVELDAETASGHYKPYTAWIPKSVICV